MRAIRTGSRSADLPPRPSRDCDRLACPPTRWPPPSARCGSSWSSPRIRPRSFAARCCRNTIASPQILAFRDRPDLTPDEQEESLADLQREIAAAWQTDEVRRARVTPLDEVRAGLVVFEQSLWDALPQYLRAVDRALDRDVPARALPRDVAPIRFGSWIGGDRDGNPSITPEVTRQATWLARWQAADLYLKDIVALRSELSLSASHASEELRARVGAAHEPYRALLAEVRDRLEATRDLAEEALAESAPKLTGIAPYLAAAELAEPLELCFRSLVSTGNEVMAAGRLTDILRRVDDVRRHARAAGSAAGSRSVTPRLWIGLRRPPGWAGMPRCPSPTGSGCSCEHLTAGDVRLDDLPTTTVRRSGARRARHVPRRCAHPSGVARRVRHHDGERAVRRARRRVSADGGRHARTRSASCRSSRRRAISSTRAPS